MSKGFVELFTVYQLWKHVHLWRSRREGAAGEELGRIPNGGEHLDDVIHPGRGETNAAFEEEPRGRAGPTPQPVLGPSAGPRPLSRSSAHS